jgi:malectin (di-glucose binding ER protein)
VNLYFAENNPADEYVGGRVFNVKMQASVVLNKLDIFAEVGADTALVKSADIAVTNGQLKIELDAAIHNPKIDAIEILQTSAAPEMKMNFTYPDGTPVVGTLNYKMSTSLLSLGGNTPLTNGRAICYLFASPSGMGLAGTFQVNLSLTDSAAHTLWQLSLSLDPASANISGVQSTALNVVVAKQ